MESRRRHGCLLRKAWPVHDADGLCIASGGRCGRAEEAFPGKNPRLARPTERSWRAGPRRSRGTHGSKPLFIPCCNTEPSKCRLAEARSARRESRGTSIFPFIRDLRRGTVDAVVVVSRADTRALQRLARARTPRDDGEKLAAISRTRCGREKPRRRAEFRRGDTSRGFEAARAEGVRAILKAMFYNAEAAPGIRSAGICGNVDVREIVLDTGLRD